MIVRANCVTENTEQWACVRDRVSCDRINIVVSVFACVTCLQNLMCQLICAVLLVHPQIFVLISGI